MQPNQSSLLLARETILTGGVIAYPTEGVWGLGCDPSNVDAVHKILQLKNRPLEKGLILIAGEHSQLGKYVTNLPDFPSIETPTTWLVAHGGKAPDWVTGGSEKVAIRISHHPLVKSICEAAGTAITSTSANPAGKPSAMSVNQVKNYFGDELDAVIPGELGGGHGASQIIDWDTKNVIRQAS